MLTKDIYGKTLSNNFSNATVAYAQFVKPKITINLLDSRHLDLDGAITNSDSYANTAQGSRGYFFSTNQLINGYERQSFTWAVADAKDKYGDVIKADGTWYAMPSSLDDDYEMGWWSNTKSQANGVFASAPTITIPITAQKVNKVRITTSEFHGQILSFQLTVSNATYGNMINKTFTLDSDEYFKDVYIKSNIATQSDYMADEVVVSVLSTKNGLDYARIHEVSPMYEVDITDYVIDFSVSKTRDLHDSSLPIAGTQAGQLSCRLDNDSKDWNILSSSSEYGPYMKKDLKINVAAGWRIKKTEEILSNTQLSANLSNSGTTITVLDTSILPTGGAGNHFTVVVDPENENREVMLCSASASDTSITVVERGFAGTDAVAHTSGAVLQFDPYEYVPIGEYYVDEWQATTSDMTVTISASDWSKFISETVLSKGFLISNATAGEAVENLLLRKNFPKADIKKIEKYHKNTVAKGAVARYSFAEDKIDRDGNIISLEGGFKTYFWGMKPGFEFEYREIPYTNIPKNLSLDDRINNRREFTAPDFYSLSSNISNTYSASNAAVNFETFSFTGGDGDVYSQYFNGVVEGYYIPLWDGDQDLVVDVQNGGVRLYIDNTVIAESWVDNSTLTSISAYTYLSNTFLNLTAGTPYKLKIEFFHAEGSGNFTLRLFKNNSTLSSKTIVSPLEAQAVSAEDSIGSRNADFDVTVDEFNHHQNDGVYYYANAVSYGSNVSLGEPSSIVSSKDDKSVLLQDSGYVRIPNHETIRLSEKDFSYEIIANFYDGFFSSNGEYLSSWANSTPSNGFEFFFNNTSSHGFKVVTSTGVQTVSTNSKELEVTNYYHIIATYAASSKQLRYYIDGQEVANATITGTIVTQTGDITIAGRGASYTINTGPVDPAVTRNLYIDEFSIYDRCLSAGDILDRYYSYKVTSMQTFPFLYAIDETIRGAIDEFSFADLGRFYIDEENKARYEHYYRFFEEFIDQHANVQYTLADDKDIIDANLTVQLQTNKVVVKVVSVATNTTALQGIWRADSPTTLATVSLEANAAIGDDYLFVSTTVDPPFFTTGYLIVDSEIVKYSNKTDNSFIEVQRGQFGTTEANHTAGAKVREVRVYDAVYDSSPVFEVNSPFIIGIFDEEPDLIDILKFEPGPYLAKFIISASDDTDVDSFVYAEGTHPLTGKEYFTSISGKPVIVAGASEQVAEQTQALSENIRKYGLKELTIESKFMSDTDFASELASFIISKMSEPVPIINVTTMGVPTLQLGDKVRISSLDAFDIINGDYWLVSHEISYSNGVTSNLVLRKVV